MKVKCLDSNGTARNVTMSLDHWFLFAVLIGANLSLSPTAPISLIPFVVAVAIVMIMVASVVAVTKGYSRPPTDVIQAVSTLRAELAQGGLRVWAMRVLWCAHDTNLSARVLMRWSGPTLGPKDPESAASTSGPSLSVVASAEFE